MKLTALAVVILALGIAVGFALAGGASEGPASAAPKCPGPSPQCPTPTPAPPQQREDQIIIHSGRQRPPTAGDPGIPTDWGFQEGEDRPAFIVAIDTDDYPEGSVFRFEAMVANLTPAVTLCARLFDLTAGAPVVGTELCETLGQFDNARRMRSVPISLLAGEREYTIQVKCIPVSPSTSCSNSTWPSSRVIAEWTE